VSNHTVVEFDKPEEVKDVLTEVLREGAMRVPGLKPSITSIRRPLSKTRQRGDDDEGELCTRNGAVLAESKVRENLGFQ